MRTHTSLLLIVLILLGTLSSGTVPVARADAGFPVTSWDLAGDFCTGRNPCGPWQYGSKASLAGAFQRFSAAGTSSWNGVPIWSNGGETAPLLWKNTSSQTGFGVTPGQVSLHPGPNGELAAVHWTAPEQMAVRMEISFKAGDSAALDMYILGDGVELYHQRTAKDFTVSFVIPTNIGSQFDFLVGGGYNFGNTPVDVHITKINWWDLAAEFDTVYNPAGRAGMQDTLGLKYGWEYGWKANLTSDFQRFSWTGTSSWNGVPIWSNGGETAPMIWKNTSTETGFGVAPGEVSLLPGPNGEFAVVRWTASGPMDVRMQISFGAGDTAAMDLYILHNGTQFFHDRRADTVNMSSPISVNAGDTIDFLVGGGYTNGNTPLDLKIFPARAWDIETNYNALYNPSGPWEYGWKTSTKGSFTRFSWAGDSSWNGVPVWSNGGETAPMIWKNTSSQSNWGVAPAQVSLHPGPNGEFAAVRWTAPTEMFVRVKVTFMAGDAGALDFYVQHKRKGELYHTRSTKDNSYEVVFGVITGDTLDFLVGGGYNYGNTPISIQITEDLFYFS